MWSRTLGFALFYIIFTIYDSLQVLKDECPGEKSACVLEKDCENTTALLPCGHVGNDTLFCCSEKIKSGAFARKVCRELKAKMDSNEDIFEIGISGGDVALFGEYKHMALLGFDYNGTIKWLCGGSLISEQYVLTAAHCIYDSNRYRVKYVRLGDLDYSTDADESPYQEFNISEIFVYKDYKNPSTYHDIALLKLDRPANFTVTVRPACVNTEEEISDNLLAVVAGWGLTESWYNKPSTRLRKAHITTYSHESCKTYYEKQQNKLKDGIIKELQLCAGSPIDANNTCMGDSGGPLQIDKDVLSTIIGITSFGKSCGEVGIGIPGVYTRVSHYIDWIESHVWGGQKLEI